jgi:hypothetical protein
VVGLEIVQHWTNLGPGHDRPPEVPEQVSVRLQRPPAAVHVDVAIPPAAGQHRIDVPPGQRPVSVAVVQEYDAVSIQVPLLDEQADHSPVVWRTEGFSSPSMADEDAWFVKTANCATRVRRRGDGKVMTLRQPAMMEPFGPVEQR